MPVKTERRNKTEIPLSPFWLVFHSREIRDHWVIEGKNVMCPQITKKETDGEPERSGSEKENVPEV